MSDLRDERTFLSVVTSRQVPPWIQRLSRGTPGLSVIFQKCQPYYITDISEMR
jgi:hypothetical protein